MVIICCKDKKFKGTELYGPFGRYPAGLQLAYLIGAGWSSTFRSLFRIRIILRLRLFDHLMRIFGPGFSGLVENIIMFADEFTHFEDVLPLVMQVLFGMSQDVGTNVV